MRALATALAMLSLAACSVVLDFSEENLPCDSRGSCLAGFVCEEGLCVTEPPPDAGPPVVLPCGGLCRLGQTCVEETATCIYDCSLRLSCPPGMTCDSVDKRCKLVTGNKNGALCADNFYCESGMCMKSATGMGVCVSAPVISDAGNSICPSGSISRPFYPQGVPSADTPADAGPDVVRICVPFSFAPCSGQDDCGVLGLTCTLWSVPGTGRRLVPACSFEPGVSYSNQGDPIGADGGPDAGYGEANATCSTNANCRTGICLRGTSPARYCSQPCRDEEDCEVSLHQCRLASYEGVPPSVKMCLRADRTLMCACTPPTDPVCGSDAPTCATMGFRTRCRMPCAKNNDCGNDACSEGLCYTPDGGPPDGGC